MVSVSRSTPRRASTTSTRRSASSTLRQAARTMACSRRRPGAGVKMPGVSTNTSWVASRMVIPRMRRRVVWTLDVTIETLVPTRRLSRVDLPTFGAPRMAMNPQRVAGWLAHGCSCLGSVEARQQPLGGGLLGGPLGAAGRRRRRRRRRARPRSRRSARGAARTVLVTSIGGQAEPAALGPLLKRRSWRPAAARASLPGAAPNGRG